MEEKSSFQLSPIAYSQLTSNYLKWQRDCFYVIAFIMMMSVFEEFN
ncbi:hypothetical protein HMPREF0495_01564 [Levilactobacillus brevis ATCC 14869 = DSM 20054]|uniref:Uncharacterized protein n=1 Tax=Levilactobacillus brevis ATCC 14869 = DSM 20054 TaxID=649758 RepID=U2PHR3_LEVBR|nr:hypothetical protein HMPREF0495_01564 [Levilactobacillus brevis ATCC 14869 = DSM 20054]